MVKMIKSPLRYPGGKSRAIDYLCQHLPDDFSEYREPMVGGGSMFIYLKQKNPGLKIWINDLNPELYLFWKIAQSDLVNLVNEIKKCKENYQDGKQLFRELTTVNIENLTDLERATRFFILNRITFSGTVESGGFSQGAFEKRFTDSSIERLELLEQILKDITITNLDFENVIKDNSNNAFLFLDPPYYNNAKSKLYGKKGNLHSEFNHKKFINIIKKCQHKWLITYDNCKFIKDNFVEYYLQEWELQYGMNNYKKSSVPKGKELLIMNYLPSIQDKQNQQLTLNFY
ncbi:DNA adenine methylase [Cyanobacterium aponinum AL20118]|nr:DNA adenine methylase [Cyanobacterium aponinum]WPF87210.1 DNA adenine methylase [Cyanobacterium aponinum AL20115]